MVTGGAAMHLNDAIGRCPRARVRLLHHEQAASMAAQGYYRLTNRLAAVNVTAGPGGTNAITGVFGAWTDSLGMVVVSGQVKWETLVRSTDSAAPPARRPGGGHRPPGRADHEVRGAGHDPRRSAITSSGRSIWRATGRPGPVWLDVPINVQGAMVDPSRPRRLQPRAGRSRPDDRRAGGVRRDRARLGRAERPVVLAGAGVRLAGAAEEFAQLVERLGIPVVTGFNAHDLSAERPPALRGPTGHDRRPRRQLRRAERRLRARSSAAVSISGR